MKRQHAVPKKLEYDSQLSLKNSHPLMAIITKRDDSKSTFVKRDFKSIIVFTSFDLSKKRCSPVNVIDLSVRF